MKAFPDINIVNSSGKPRALATVASKRGGRGAIGDGLGFADYGRARRKLPLIAQQILREVDDEADAAALASTPDIDERADSLITAIDTAAYTVGTQTTQTLPADLLPLREILGLNESQKNIRGTKAVQESKIVSLQQLLEGYHEDLKRPGTTERADQIEREIQKAEDQLTAAQDSIDAINQQLRSQVRQIRGRAVTDAGVPAVPVAPTPLPPADKGGLKEWAKALTSSRAYASPTGRKGRSRTARPHRKHHIVAPQPPE